MTYDEAVRYLLSLGRELAAPQHLCFVIPSEVPVCRDEARNLTHDPWAQMRFLGAARPGMTPQATWAAAMCRQERDPYAWQDQAAAIPL